MRFESPQRLDGKALTAGALIYVAELAGALLADHLARVHPDKHPHVEVDTEAEEGDDVPPVPGKFYNLTDKMDNFQQNLNKNNIISNKCSIYQI